MFTKEEASSPIKGTHYRKDCAGSSQVRASDKLLQLLLCTLILTAPNEAVVTELSLCPTSRVKRGRSRQAQLNVGKRYQYEQCTRHSSMHNRLRTKGRARLGDSQHMQRRHAHDTIRGMGDAGSGATSGRQARLMPASSATRKRGTPTTTATVIENKRDSAPVQPTI